jgi:hypothetical protein
MKDAAVGDKFYIVRAGQQVVHPRTRKKLGHIVEILGMAEVIKFDLGETIARITHSFMDINTGDLLDTYYEMTPPLAEASYRKPETDGYVVATRNLRMLNSTYDIVFIDRGKNNGVETGDLIRAIDIKKDTIFNTRHKVASGIIQVIRTNDSTSTAIVRSASDPVTVGTLLGKAE